MTPLAHDLALLSMALVLAGTFTAFGAAILLSRRGLQAAAAIAGTGVVLLLAHLAVR